MEVGRDGRLADTEHSTGSSQRAVLRTSIQMIGVHGIIQLCCLYRS